MKRFVPLFLAIGLVWSHSADARKGNKSKKTKEQIEEQESLLTRQAQEKSTPAHYRWADAFSGGKIRISHVDVSKAPTLKLHVSIMKSGGGDIVPLDNWGEVETLQVLLSKPGSKKTVPLVEFKNGKIPKPEEGTPDDEMPPLGELLPMDKANIPLDVVVVAAGHSGFKDVAGLEYRHKSALANLLTKLGDANINVIWYGPMLYTYRKFEGVEGELSRFDENLNQCEVERRKYRVLKAQGEDDEEELEKPPCGLHEGETDAIRKAVRRMRYRGKYARLFGIDSQDIKPCTSDSTVQSTALRFFDVDSVAESTYDVGAFEEALRVLLKYSGPNRRKAIIVLGTGRDGYLEDETKCRAFYTQSDRFCAQVGLKKRGKKGRQAIRDCVQKALNKRANAVQEGFRRRAIPWLTLLRAANIRVFSIAYAMDTRDGEPLSHPYERERLELLSQKTGGTYREVHQVGSLPAVASATADELNADHVVLVDAGLASETDYKVRVKARLLVGGKTLVPLISPEVGFTSPHIGSGAKFWLSQKNKWLKSKVGTVLYWVIVVFILVLLLLLLWLFFKLIKAIVTKVAKALFKNAGKAVKDGA